MTPEGRANSPMPRRLRVAGEQAARQVQTGPSGAETAQALQSCCHALDDTDNQSAKS